VSASLAPYTTRSSSIPAVAAISQIGAPPPVGAVDWPAAELCLDLLLLVLLRNRDRLQLLWPPVFDHLAGIIKGRGVDHGVVQAAALGVLRLCQRLLPYKPEAAEPLLRGLQLVPSLDPEVAWTNAELIAAEMLTLVKVGSPHIKTPWGWASACNLLKMTSFRPEAFPIGLEALTWMVHEALTPLNYVHAIEAAVWFVERSTLEHPNQKAEALSLLVHLAEWLEGWAASLAGAGLNPDQLGAFITAKSEFWLFLVEVLTKLAENPDMEVRSVACSTLQRAAVAGESLEVLASSLAKGLGERVLPAIEALSKKVRSRDMPQADVTIHELVRVVTKMVLLYLNQLTTTSQWPALWVGVLTALCSTELWQRGAERSSAASTAKSAAHAA